MDNKELKDALPGEIAGGDGSEASKDGSGGSGSTGTQADKKPIEGAPAADAVT